MNVLKSILKYIAYTFLASLVALCVYTFVMTEILKKDYVNIFGYTYFVVATGSMSGTIEVNDVVIVKITDNYNVGDVITYIKDGSFITHRVVSVNDNQIITKGDVNNIEDDPILKENVIGIVSTVFSLSILFKFLGVSIIIFVFLTLINFEKIFKKYIVKKEIKNDYEIISLENDEEIRILNIILRMIQLKNKTVKNIVLDKENIVKFQFVYKCLISLLKDNSIYTLIDKPMFKELYDYDFETVGLDGNVTNKLYDMHIYSFLKILVFAILYDDKYIFDGVYKILKYKTKVDRREQFIKLNNANESIKIENLISFMREISKQMPNNEIIGLKELDELLR